jgi:DNA-binding NtrC family response regulator
LSLLVGLDGTFTSHTLPQQGEISIGRDAGNAISIGHRSVSRRHALLRIGRTVVIEDLGSANGVRVQGRALPQRGNSTVSIGEVIELGEALLVLRRTNAAPRPRRLWPHGYFEGRVEEQCARSGRSKAGFAVLRLNVEATPSPGVIEEAFGATLRAADVLALYAPGEYEILLVDASPDDAELVLRRLASHLSGAGVRARTGLACHPRDGSAPETLIARACDAVRGIGPDDGRSEGQGPVLSAAMQKLRRQVEQVAPSDLSVLILGETGAGKEVMAETLHRLSPRAKGPFLRLNCAALSESLLESELFGHEKGAFTGAHQAKPGLLESANGGTVLLDELGELPPATQVKLLRVLEERKVLRIGALTPRPIDVRFLAATNRDLDAEVAMGRFRLDLYFRLNTFSMVVPPLRERSEEIESLARAFITQACRRTGRRAEPMLSAEALERLRAYSWPGNIRELRNTIERAVLLSGDGPILSEHLPTEKMGATLAAVAARAPEPAAPAREADGDAFDGGERTQRVPLASSSETPRLADQIGALERQRILDTLEQCGGNQTKAAKVLGISRNTLIARLDAYRIARPKKPSGPL